MAACSAGEIATELERTEVLPIATATLPTANLSDLADFDSPRNSSGHLVANAICFITTDNGGDRLVGESPGLLRSNVEFERTLFNRRRLLVQRQQPFTQLTLLPFEFREATLNLLIFLQHLLGDRWTRRSPVWPTRLSL